MAEKLSSGRWETVLTDSLVDELCAIHKEGDILSATAAACCVHPTQLRLWLEKGAELDAPDPYCRLFSTFALIESSLRRETLARIRDPFAKNERGNIWYMQRRWREWREDHVKRPDDVYSVTEMLMPKDRSSLTIDDAKAIVKQLAANMPEQLRPIFTEHGWEQRNNDEAIETDGDSADDDIEPDERD